MVPIHESDLAENRWKEAQWNYYELWEKVEQRFRRKRTLLVFAVVLVFLALSSIPIVKDRAPKWTGFAAARRLASELDRAKLRAAQIGRAVKLEVFAVADGLAYRTSLVEHCGAAESVEVLREGPLLRASGDEVFTLLEGAAADRLGLKTMQNQFCYSPLSQENLSEATFGILPAKDLTEDRLDRLSIVRIAGSSADISFD